MTEQNGQRAPENKVCGYEYTVKRGDSFYLIAHRLGVPLRDLLDANSDINPARLMVGDVLCIPMEEDDRPQETIPPEAVPSPLPEIAEPEQEPEQEEPEVPEAGAEDTPEDLETPASPETPAPSAPENACAMGRRYVVQEGETTADIQMSAGLNLHTLEMANPGRDLTALAPGEELCVPEENIPCEVPTTYTLRADDTLESVALRHNVSVGALLRANPCLAPGDFVTGVTVLLGDET